MQPPETNPGADIVSKFNTTDYRSKEVKIVETNLDGTENNLNFAVNLF